MTARILWIDDEPYTMKDWADVLREEGFNLTCCETTEQAVRHYNDDYYDLIILDRMMPAGEIFEQEENENTAKTGFKVYQDLRRRHHLEKIPIIILTQYYDTDEANEIISQDERVTVRSKNVLPTALLQIVQNMIDRYRLTPITPRLLDDEHPNVAPYYAWDIASNKPVRLYFVRSASNDLDKVFDPASRPLWLYAQKYEDYLSDPINHRFVLKTLPHEGHSIRIAGLYFTGGYGPLEAWSHKILFEVAPWNRSDFQQRQLRGVGKVMVVRFLRECLYRKGQLVENIVVNVSRFDESEAVMPNIESGKAYLQSLGFTVVDDNPQLLRIGHEAARRLLMEVSHPYPNSTAETE